MRVESDAKVGVKVSSKLEVSEVSFFCALASWEVYGVKCS